MSMVAEPTQKCSSCNQSKPLSAFGKNNQRPNGRSVWCVLCRNKHARKRYTKLPQEQRRDARLRSRYGISFLDYVRMYESQGGCCAACREPADAITEDGQLPLRVDHDHTTGEVRGLLCHGCNSAIGYMNDDPTRLEKAAEYLRTYGD